MTAVPPATAELQPADTRGGPWLRLRGDWRLRTGLPAVSDVLKDLPDPAAGKVLRFADDGLDGWDTGLTAFLLGCTDVLEAGGWQADFSELPAGVQRLMELARAVPENAEAHRTGIEPNWLARLGLAALNLVAIGGAMLEFLGELALSFVRLITGRARMRARDLWFQMQQCGADALPIVLLINVLVGMILAFVGVVQLQQFGAAIFVANLVALAMLREMGVLMTGIIISGRTGASFAAQLGAMQANEEVDAFRSFGIPPMDFLVLPRVLALVFMMPLLTIFADAIGILGGMLVGAAMMDLSMRAYWNQTLMSATMGHFMLGVGKSFVFGGLIALCGCYQGIRCGRNAQAVGQATTRAVVAAITSLIVADAVFAVLCNELGI
ncbi:MAG: ABC transporter permease [Verrucomicrobiales bacterium]|nr:ABC transporter permease [Verrucomicrobiales bacterium]